MTWGKVDKDTYLQTTESMQGDYSMVMPFLVKALLEKKQKDQQNNKNDKQNKKQKKDKQQQKQQQNQQDNRPKPQQSKLSPQQVEQYLRSLIQREKDVQDKMNQNKTAAPNQPDKDW